MNIIPVWYWTDANDWCTAADPLDIPELKWASWTARKSRSFRAGLAHAGQHVRRRQADLQNSAHYGGAVTDFRAFTKAVVA